MRMTDADDARRHADRSAAEANRAAALLGAELDVGDLGSGDEGFVTTFVGDRQHIGRTRQRRLDPLFEIVTICVVGEFNADLAGGLRHSNTYVHTSHAIAVPSPPSSDDDSLRSPFGAGVALTPPELASDDDHVNHSFSLERTGT